jgi:hypothetical protein
MLRETDPPYENNMHLIQHLGRMIILGELLAKMKEKGPHILIFSQMSQIPRIRENDYLFRQYGQYIILSIVDRRLTLAYLSRMLSC